MASSKVSNKTHLQRLRASCDGCFLAKVKCSKTRPTCFRCLACGTDCKYSPSLRVGKPSTNRQISNSNININAADRDTNIDEAFRFASDSQAMPIAPDEKKNIAFGFDTDPPISSFPEDERRENLSSANMTGSLPNDVLADAYDLALPPSTTELFDPLLSWMAIPPNELGNPVVQNDQGTMMSWPNSPGAVPQLNSFTPLFDSQPSNLPFPPRTNAENPSSNALLDASYPPDCRTNTKISSPPCNCLTTCLQSLQALHNHSSTTRLISAFDTALTINRKAVEGCASILACSECISKSGSNTTTMLLATIMDKILSFYQVELQSEFSGTTGADSQMSIGNYRVANEDGHWFRNEILWRELRKLEDLFGRFREVCGRNGRDKNAGVYSALLGHLSKRLQIAYEELRMQQYSA